MIQEKNERLIEKIKRTLLHNSLYSEELCNEKMLAAEFGLSRTPIRDALKVLEKEGIIQRRQKKGISLRVPSVQEVSEIYEIRLLLETYAIKKVAETITAEGIAELEAITQKFQHADEIKDPIEADHIDQEFHSKIFELADNQYLARMVKNSRLLILVFKFSTRINIIPPPGVKDDHVQILEALRKHDKAQAVRVVKRHIHKSEQTLLSRFLDYPTQPRQTSSTE